MQLNEKILQIYPELTGQSNNPLNNPLYILQDDGQGVYIKQWNLNLHRPTQEQLDSIE